MQIDLGKAALASQKTNVEASSPLKSSGSTVLPINVGETVKARVTKVATVTQEQVALIQSKTIDTLAKNLAKSTGDTIANRSSGQTAIENISNTGFKTQGSQASLNLAELKVNDKHFTVLTDIFLQKQDVVNIKLNQDLQLELLSKSATLNSAALATSKSSKLDSHQTALTPNIKLEIQRTLRELLPQQGKPDLVNNLNSIHELLMLTPKSKETVNIINMLNTIKASAINVTNTPNAVDIKQAFMNSGNFLEAKLLTAAKLNNAVNQNNNFLAQDNKANLLKLAEAANRIALAGNTDAKLQPGHINAPASAAGNNLLGAQATQTNANNSALNIKVSDQVIKNLSSAPTQKTGEHSSTAKADINIQNIPTFILQFLGSQMPSSQTLRESKLLQTQLLVLVHQLSLVNLSKIRLNQLRPETHMKGGAEVATAQSGTLHFDLPTRHEGVLHNTHIEIDTEYEQANNDDNTVKKDKCWNVKLNIAIEDTANLYIHLKFLNDNLIVKLWADKPQILTDAKNKFATIKNSLSAQGVNVQSVEYFEGKPTTGENTIKYTLVDIKT